MATFSTVKDRAALKPRRDPYWSKLSLGCYLGFRKMTAASDGTWSARCMDKVAGKQVYVTLGEFSELADNKRHDAAKKAAEAWFEHLGRGGSSKVFTVADACTKYVDKFKDAGNDAAASEAKGRFNMHVLADKRFADVELTKLTPAHLEAWKKALRERPTTSGPNKGGTRSDSSINREMVFLRAAFNLAFKDGLVTSDFAWRGKLAAIKGAGNRRELYLDIDQRRKFVAHAHEDIADFMRGMMLLPLRPGALAALTVAQFDKRLNMLTVGKDKAGAGRILALPEGAAAFFANLAKDKIGAAPLFARADGSAWNRSTWKYPVGLAVKAAGLPTGTSAYTLRHSVITDLVHGGVDLLTVAKLAGTSVLMIQNHYGHLTQAKAREALARLAL